MKIQVWIEIRKNGVFHVIHIEERRQIIHELRFAFLRSRKFILSRWRPTLLELEIFSLYLKLLCELCEMKVYPTREQIDDILSESRLTVLDLLFRKEYGLYKQMSKPFNLEAKEMVELSEILARPLKQSYLRTTDTYVFGAPTRDLSR